VSNRIDQRLAQLQQTKRKALVPFFTAGDPAGASCTDIMHALVSAGADLIELGMPFSDPMADGPVIQQSSERALTRKIGIDSICRSVQEFRNRDQATPIVLMGYLNPIEVRGVQRFAKEVVAAGVDGVLLVDLPTEEAASYRRIFSAEHLHFISLAAPTTSEQRLQQLSQNAEGYIYYVSFAGVTGANQIDMAQVQSRVDHLRQLAKIPVLVGFGIKDATSAAALAQFTDGVIVGSALVEIMASSQDPIASATQFIQSIRAGLDQVVRSNARK